MAQNALQDIHYQVELLRAQAVTDSWIMIIESSTDLFSIAGSGVGGSHEFLPYLMPDLTCYILLLSAVPVLEKSKEQQQAILIAFQGEKSLLPPDAYFNAVSSPQFKVIFQPYSIVVYSHSQEALQQQLYFDTPHPSYKSLFEKLPMGFEILTAKERHLQPYTTSLLQVNVRESEKIFETVRKPAELSKQLKRKQTRPNAEIQEMIKNAQEQAEKQLENSRNGAGGSIVSPSKNSKSPARAFEPENDFSDISDPEINDDDLMKYMSSLPNENKPTPKRPSQSRPKVISSQSKKSERQSKIARVQKAPTEELRINFTEVVMDQKSSQIVPAEAKTAPELSQDQVKLEKGVKETNNKSKFTANFQRLQEVIPCMENEKKRKYNVTLATAVEHCMEATQNEMPERTKTVQEALARVSLEEVVMLGIQNGSSVTNLAEALTVLKEKLPSRKFEILKLVTASSKSLNTEEVCLGELSAWIEYLESTELL